MLSIDVPDGLVAGLSNGAGSQDAGRPSRHVVVSAALRYQPIWSEQASCAAGREWHREQFFVRAQIERLRRRRSGLSYRRDLHEPMRARLQAQRDPLRGRKGGRNEGLASRIFASQRQTAHRIPAVIGSRRMHAFVDQWIKPTVQGHPPDQSVDRLGAAACIRTKPDRIRDLYQQFLCEAGVSDLIAHYRSCRVGIQAARRPLGRSRTVGVIGRHGP